MPLPMDIALCLVLQVGVSTDVPECLIQNTWQRTEEVVVCESHEDFRRYISMNMFAGRVGYRCDWKQKHEVILGGLVYQTSNGSTQSALVYKGFVGPEEWVVEGPLNVESIMNSYRSVYIVDIVDFVAL